MHVLMFGLDNTMFTQENRGDLPNRLKQYAAYVDEISIVIYTKKGYEPIKIADNITAYPTNSKSKWRFPFDAVRIGKKIHAKNQINVVTAQDPFACGLAGHLMKRACKTPFVVNIVSSFFDDPFWLKEHWSHWLLNRLGKRIVRKADGVRVECEIERQKIISLGVAPQKVKVAPVLVDLSKFVNEKESVREKYINGYEHIVLFIGRLSIEKNVKLLIEAAKIVSKDHPKILFLIVGGGAEEANLKAQAEDCKSILFTGRVPHTEVPKYHKAADVFVLPSLYEGIPLVVVEAAAGGKPVICTDVRDAPDVIVQGVTGFIVKKDNPNEMAQRIVEIVKNKKLAEQMGKAGQKLVLEKFDPKENLKACVDLWKQVAK